MCSSYTLLPFNDPVFNSLGREILTLLLGGLFRHIGPHKQHLFPIASFHRVGRVAEIGYGFDLVIKVLRLRIGSDEVGILGFQSLFFAYPMGLCKRPSLLLVSEMA